MHNAADSTHKSFFPINRTGKYRKTKPIMNYYEKLDITHAC